MPRTDVLASSVHHVKKHMSVCSKTSFSSDLAFLSHLWSPHWLLVSVSVCDHFPFPCPCPFGLLTSVSFSLVLSGFRFSLLLSPSWILVLTHPVPILSLQITEMCVGNSYTRLTHS